jgi:Flp pilus assembly protein TadD
MMIRPAILRIAALALTAVPISCDQSSSAPTPGAAGTTSTTVSAEAVAAALDAAQTYLARQQLPEAHTIAAELVRKAPRDWRAHDLLARVLFMRGHEAESRGEHAAAREHRAGAMAAALSAVEVEPESAALHHGAAMMARAAGDDSTALKHFQQASRLEPSNPQYALHEAQLLLAAGRLDDAEAAIRRALAIDDAEPFALATLALIALERNDRDEAIRLIGQARAVDPQSLPLRVQEARIRRRAGQPRQALELLVGLSEAERSKEVAGLEIAAAYAALGEHVRAAEAAERCFRANPRSWRAAVAAGEARREAGDHAAAKDWCDRAAAIAPGQAEVRSLRERIVGRE